VTLSDVRISGKPWECWANQQEPDNADGREAPFRGCERQRVELQHHSLALAATKVLLLIDEKGRS
jgi:hypothetical protein